jgi:hypothetical protein
MEVQGAKALAVGAGRPPKIPPFYAVGAKLAYCEHEIGSTYHAQWYVTIAPTVLCVKERTKHDDRYEFDTNRDITHDRG